MKLSLVESGGWSAGIPARPQLLDFAKLDNETAQEGQRLAEDLITQLPPPMEENPHARDEMEFTIRIEDQGSSREFTMKSMAMTREFSSLMNWLKLRLKEQSQR
jgi:hypothetical protein